MIYHLLRTLPWSWISSPKSPLYIVTLEKVCIFTSDGGRACTWQANDGGRALWTKCGRFTETGESAWTEPSWCTNEKGIDIVWHICQINFFSSNYWKKDVKTVLYSHTCRIKCY